MTRPVLTVTVPGVVGSKTWTKAAPVEWYCDGANGVRQYATDEDHSDALSALHTAMNRTEVCPTMPKTKEDAFTIRRVTIEIGNDRGQYLDIDIHPPSQTATVGAHWPSGQWRKAEHLPLDTLIEQLRGLLPKP